MFENCGRRRQRRRVPEHATNEHSAIERLSDFFSQKNISWYQSLYHFVGENIIFLIIKIHVHIDYTAEKKIYICINGRHTLFLSRKPVPDKQTETSFSYPLLSTPSKFIKMLKSDALFTSCAQSGSEKYLARTI